MPAVACPSCRTALTLPDTGGPFACPKCRAAVGPPPVPVQAPARKQPPLAPFGEAVFAALRMLAWTGCILFAIGGAASDDLKAAKLAALMFVAAMSLDGIWRAWRDS